MKIAAISDTHGLHWSLGIPKGAVLVHTGADSFYKNKKTARWVVFVLSRTIDLYSSALFSFISLRALKNPKTGGIMDIKMITGGGKNLQEHGY